MDMDKLMDKGVEFIVDFGPKVLGAILIWIVGSWLIKKTHRRFTKSHDKAKL